MIDIFKVLTPEQWVLLVLAIVQALSGWQTQGIAAQIKKWLAEEEEVKAAALKAESLKVAATVYDSEEEAS
jgi:hypothetical protein